MIDFFFKSLQYHIKLDISNWTLEHITERGLCCCRWYKFIDGSARKQPVALNDRVKQVSGTLIIKEAKVEDSGKYLCVVNNSVGGNFFAFVYE